MVGRTSWSAGDLPVALPAASSRERTTGADPGATTLSYCEQQVAVGVGVVVMISGRLDLGRSGIRKAK